MGAGVGAAGRQQFGDRIFAVERHQLVAQLVGDRMERDRQADAELGSAARHHGHDAGRRQRDLALGEAQSLRVHDDGQRLGQVVVVVERLAHAHEHDVGHVGPVARHRPHIESVVGEHDLADDFGGREVADQGLGAGVAEPAGQGAADLGRDAERAALALRDVDRLDLLPVGQAQQPLARAVGRHLRRRDLGPGQREALGQARAEPLGKRGHG